MSSVLLSAETHVMINSYSFEQTYDVSKIQRIDSKAASAPRNKSRRKISKKPTRIGKVVRVKVQKRDLIHLLLHDKQKEATITNDGNSINCCIRFFREVIIKDTKQNLISYQSFLKSACQKKGQKYGCRGRRRGKNT